MGYSTDREVTLTSLILRSPTAGGQYHWVSEFSPPWCQKYLSYITGEVFPNCRAGNSFCWLLNSAVGWILATGWQGSVVGLSFLAGTIVRDYSLHLHPHMQLCLEEESLCSRTKFYHSACHSIEGILTLKQLPDSGPHHSEQQQLQPSAMAWHATRHCSGSICNHFQHIDGQALTNGASRYTIHSHSWPLCHCDPPFSHGTFAQQW